MSYDKIIIGAGLYGLYAALYCAKKGQRVIVLEKETLPFQRATFINQARIHQGYHYPRSLSTAIKSAHYFERFHRDYDFCINGTFEQIYATSSRYSWTDGEQFKKFCEAARIPCAELKAEHYFKTEMCDGAFLTREFTYDARLLKDYFMEQLSEYSNVGLRFNVDIAEVRKDGSFYILTTDQHEEFKAGFILNATYAGINQISQMFEADCFKIKYELCEIITCQVNEKLRNVGFTVMDGPFFSIMPFGKTGLHSLTSVTFTPHTTSYDTLPIFHCQQKSEGYCSAKRLGNCNSCIAKPETAYPYMSNLARKYLKDEYQFQYENSLYTLKPVLMASEVDDSRPTLVSVLSGKINTVYDLDEVLDSE